MNRLKKIINIFKLIVSLFLLALLFYWVPAEELLRIFKTIDPGYLFLAFVLSVCGMIISILKLHQIFKTTHYHHSVKHLGIIYYIAYLFNNFIPTSLGGDVVKTMQITHKLNTPFSISATVVMLERFSGILVLITIGLLVSVLTPGLYGAMSLGVIGSGKFWVIMAASVVVLSFLFMLLAKNNIGLRKKKENWMKLLDKALEFPHFNFNHVIIILGYSLSFHMLRALNLVLLSEAVGSSLLYWHALALLPLIALVSFLPISMGGLGLREGIITFCLAGIGIPVEIGFSIALILRLFSLIHSTVGVIFFSFFNNFRI